MKILLDINDVDKLLSGQTEAGVELKDYVVAEFVRRHLKGIVNEEMVAIASVEAKKLVADHWYSGYKLKPEIIEAIKKNTHEQLEVIIKDEINILKKECNSIMLPYLQKITADMKATVEDYDRQVRAYEEKCANLVKELCDLSTDEAKGKILAKLINL